MNEPQNGMNPHLIRNYILFIFSLLPMVLSGQDGIPYISYYESRDGFESQNWSICQDTGHSMYFANKQGVTVFDGLNWKTVKLSHVPLKIKTEPETGVIYVMSDRNYGMLQRNSQGSIEYQPLTYEGELDRSLKNILFTDSSVIFYGDNHISFHSLEDQVLQKRIFSSSYGTFGGMILADDNIYIVVQDSGLYRFSGESLIEIPGIAFPTDQEVLFSLPYEKNSALIGLSGSELSVFDGKNLTEYTLSETNYLRDYGLSDGMVLNDSCYVFSTFYGGAIIVQRENGSVQSILNYNNGLPDDEVYAIGKDFNGGIWITYRYGICRVDPGLPIREYTNYQGLEGLLTNTIWYENRLYVATTEGIFFLDEVKDYSVREILVKQQPVIRQPATTSAAERSSAKGKMPDEMEQPLVGPLPVEIPEAPSAEKEKKGFFERLFSRSRRNRGEEVRAVADPAPEEVLIEEPEVDEVLREIEQPVSSAPQEPRYVRKEVRQLRSVRYVFKKVKGLNSSCIHLLSTASSLLAGSSSGLYAINDSIAIRLSDSRNITSIHAVEDSSYFVVSEDGLEILNLNEDGWLRDKKAELIGEPLFSVTHDTSYVWLSGYNSVYRLSYDHELINTYAFASPYPEELRLKYLRDTLFLFSGNDIDFYVSALDTFIQYSGGLLPDQYSSIEFIASPMDHQWLRVDQELHLFESDSRKSDPFHANFQLFNSVTALNYDENRGYWIIDDFERLFWLNDKLTEHYTPEFNVNIEQVFDASGTPADLGNLVFLPTQTPVSIHLSAPRFPGSDQTTFQYRIEGRMEDWSGWNNSSELDLFLESGEYHVYVRAKNVLGEISPEKSLFIVIKSPIYKKPWFYFSLSPILFVLLYIVFYLRERKIRRDKLILEKKVEERTIEISDQKEQIELQNDEITASITYASRIQKAILPSERLFEAAFGDYFIFYRPRDIVSGDFYWITEREEQVIFTVADCTGHGVPGAFMSMLGNSFLNEITKSKKKTLTASGILNQLRIMINAALSQSGREDSADDGMDLALCIYNPKTRELNYSGANNPLYLVRDGELHIIKPNRMPIGYFPVEKDFTGHTLKVEMNDVIYLFTDGYTDQFGGEHYKRFTTNRFRKLLMKHADKPMIDQIEYLETAFDDWKGENRQIDDVLVMGIRF